MVFENPEGTRPGGVEVHSRMKLPQFLGGFETAWRPMVSVHFDGRTVFNNNNEMMAVAVLRDDGNQCSDDFGVEPADGNASTSEGKSAREGEAEAEGEEEGEGEGEAEAEEERE